MSLKIMQLKPVKVQIISGFLGAGKTTLLQKLLVQKPENEVWAVLMNEFGQIGVDQQLLPQTDGYEIKELLGGCLCCTGQLPMQIALSRLIQEKKPDRLFIEPTGLGHPAQLLEQLTEPHWKNQIEMRALVAVVDGSRLHDVDWTEQALYQDQIKAAQIIVVSHIDVMTEADQIALDKLKSDHITHVEAWLLEQQGDILLSQLERPHVGVERKIQPLIHIQKQLPVDASLPEIRQLPYHYIESSQGYTVAGWKFSKRWKFDFYDLLDMLCELKNWLRIKGIFNTNQGWMSFNFNPDDLNYKSTDEGIDNRIEVITTQNQEWAEFEMAILKCRIDTE